MNINYYMPTKIIQGNNCIIKNSDLIKDFGKRALIVTGRSSAKKNGSLDDVIYALKENGQDYVIYDKVMSNPNVECVYEGAKEARSFKADFVIGIGGGSPMDAAKTIAMLARQDISREELFSGKYTSDVLPMIMVPTTAGTGSEVTQYSIITNDELQTKTNVGNSEFFPKIAFLDGKYMLDLPLEITINTAIDAISHSVEGMLSDRANELSDLLAKDSISRISSLFGALKDGKLDLDVRHELLYASALAGMVIAQTGTVAVHAMGYSLTYFRDIEHGRANGLLISEYLRTLESKGCSKIKEILKAFNFNKIDELNEIMDKLLGEREEISDEEIESFTAKTLEIGGNKKGSVELSDEEVQIIYKNSFN